MADETFTGPIDCNIDFDTGVLRGKTAIVTGGANGLGEVYVRALHAAGYVDGRTTPPHQDKTGLTLDSAFVSIADLNDNDGEALSQELNGSKFFHCDVTSWNDQAKLFKDAVAHSPSGKIHYVVANAGIAPPDDVFSYAGDDHEPTEPSLKTVDVNLRGALYSAKLAMHYFIKQNGTRAAAQQEDTCLVLIASGAAYFDVPRCPEYCSTKWAMRGVMHALRRTAFYYGSRVNAISPWYVRTKILSQEVFDGVKKSGVEFAEAEDAGQCLLRILSDRAINGRTLMVAPRKWAARGYLDLDLDGYRPEAKLLQEIQVDQMRNSPVSLGLFP